MAPRGRNSADLADQGVGAMLRTRKRSTSKGRRAATTKKNTKAATASSPVKKRGRAGSRSRSPRRASRSTSRSRQRVSRGKGYTLAQVAEHNTEDDLWIIIDNKVYDVTSFVSKHPGGRLPLLGMAGKDSTDPFDNYHPPAVYKWLKAYHVGEVTDNPMSDFVREHRELRQSLVDEGLFDTWMPYFIFKIVSHWALFALAIYWSLTATTLPSLLFGAALLGLFWQQLAFIGHDLCHNGVTHVREYDYLFSIIFGNTMMGISSGWWKRSHNVHHIVCNSIEADPDIQHLPIFAISEYFFKGVDSTYHERHLPFDVFAKFLVRFQHWLYYPVMAVARINLYLQSFLLVFNTKARVDYRWLELLTMIGFFVWFTSLLYAIPDPYHRLYYVLVSHAVAGILHVQITLSHFPMPVYTGVTYNDDSDEFFKTQLATTLNIDCNWMNEWFYGGLHYQVEHHLFPRLPRHNLSKIKARVMEFCARHDVPYHTCGFWEANRRVIETLRTTAANVGKTDAERYAQLIFLRDGLNAVG